MNIQHIIDLSNQIQNLGFRNYGSILLKRISFKPKSFTISEEILKEDFRLLLQLVIEWSDKEQLYQLKCYDAILEKEVEFEGKELNGVNLTMLNKDMSTIDWASAFNLTESESLDFKDERTLRPVLVVEQVMDGLTLLEQSVEGKKVADALKLKYWAGLPYAALAGEIVPIKSKTAISQRFYVFSGQPGISADEAFRFLHNRWMEKQLQQKTVTGNEGHSAELMELNTGISLEHAAGNGSRKGRKAAGKKARK